MLQHTLDSAGQLATKLNTEVAPEMTATIKDARKSLGTVERTLAEDAPLQQDFRQALQELTRAAASLKSSNRLPGASSEAIIRGKQEDTH